MLSETFHSENVVLPMPEVIARNDCSVNAPRVPLNSKVSKDFRRRLKTYASEHDMKVVEFLQQASYS
jgi:hypothetical protein